jgi:hypothetical protein
MTFVSRLEARFGRFAIPGLVQVVAVLQLVTLVLFTISTPEAQKAFIDFLELILWTQNPPDLIYSRLFLERLRHLNMTFMDRIKRSEVQSNDHLRL